MGRKQRALADDVFRRQLKCVDPLRLLKDGCRELLDLNMQIQAATSGGNRALVNQLQQAKNPSYGKINKANMSLKSLLAEFEDGIRTFEEFAREKAKRWIGKSTLKEAQTAISIARAYLSNARRAVATACEMM